MDLQAFTLEISIYLPHSIISVFWPSGLSTNNRFTSSTKARETVFLALFPGTVKAISVGNNYPKCFMKLSGFFYQWLLAWIASGHEGEEVLGGRIITILILARVAGCVCLQCCHVARTVFCSFLALSLRFGVHVCASVLKYCLLPRKLPPSHTHIHHPGGPYQVGDVPFLGLLGELWNNLRRNSLSTRYLWDIQASGATWYC